MLRSPHASGPFLLGGPFSALDAGAGSRNGHGDVEVSQSPLVKFAMSWFTAADDAGYVIDEAEVIYWGLCPGCREAAAGA